jgi:hypothetical protein
MDSIGEAASEPLIGSPSRPNLATALPPVHSHDQDTTDSDLSSTTSDPADFSSPSAYKISKQQLDYGGLDPIHEDEARGLAGIVPRAAFVALRAQRDAERLLFLRESLALRNEVMRLTDQLAAVRAQRPANSSSAAVAEPPVAGVPVSPQSQTFSRGRSFHAPATFSLDGAGSPRIQQQPAASSPASPTGATGASTSSGPQLVPFMVELAQGVASASVISDLRALAARQLKEERLKNKMSRRRLREEFAKEKENLQRILAAKEHDRLTMIEGFKAERLIIQQEAMARVDKLLGDQRRLIEEARRDAARHKLDAEKSRAEIESRKKQFNNLEEVLFVAQQQDGVAKQERSEMYLALLQMNKEKSNMENRVMSLQGQLKHSKEELQWLSLVNSFAQTSSAAFPPPPRTSSGVGVAGGVGGGAGTQRTPHVPRAGLQQTPQSAQKLLTATPGGGSTGARRRSSAMRGHRPSVAAILLGNEGMSLVEGNLSLRSKYDLQTPRGQQQALASLIADTL